MCFSTTWSKTFFVDRRTEKRRKCLRVISLQALQLQALNGFPATTPATSLVNGNSVAVSVASGTGTTGTSTGQQQSQQPNPYQGSHLTAGATGAVTGSTTATQPAVNLLALQQLLASNGASQTAAAQLALANGQGKQSQVCPMGLCTDVVSLSQLYRVLYPTVFSNNRSWPIYIHFQIAMELQRRRIRWLQALMNFHH